MADQPKPLMPHATATWLIDNTGLGFEQIAEFCGLHILEVQAMADDLAGSKYTGRDPLHSGELTQEEIAKGEKDSDYALVMQKAPVEVTRTKGPRYTPVSKRQDKPDGIAWILKSHPEVSDAQISKLIGTTRNTIGAIRERSHWNIQNIQPKDPVTLGLCSQRELDAVVAKAAKKAGLAEDAEAVAASNTNDREKLIEELRAERDANEKAAAEAVQEAEAAEWLANKRAEEEAGDPPAAG
ncbi:cell cycle transcriptional regulator TrcR [Qipengyuania sp. DSG2-2]|uniref:cell cycle transcriptional regulator TrcR n=1 Tax=Qipengyuania sp. DGS2-2 TaxID=3349631 RepID=UPI0036D26ACC